MADDREEEEEEFVDPVEQERRWKVEAAVTRTMKARPGVAVAPAELLAAVRAAWQALGRQDAITDEFVVQRINWLVSNEWFERLPDGSFRFVPPQ